jgi:hypothetical protein
METLIKLIENNECFGEHIGRWFFKALACNFRKMFAFKIR